MMIYSERRDQPPPALVLIGVSAAFLAIIALETMPIWLLTQRIAALVLLR